MSITTVHSNRPRLLGRVKSDGCTRPGLLQRLKRARSTNGVVFGVLKNIISETSFPYDVENPSATRSFADRETNVRMSSKSVRVCYVAMVFATVFANRNESVSVSQ